MGREETNLQLLANKTGLHFSREKKKKTLSRFREIKKLKQSSPMLPDTANNFTKNPEFMMQKI